LARVGCRGRATHALPAEGSESGRKPSTGARLRVVTGGEVEKAGLATGILPRNRGDTGTAAAGRLAPRSALDGSCRWPASATVRILVFVVFAQARNLCRGAGAFV